MQENPLPDGGAEARTAARTNLFMTAALYWGDSVHDVKIRDLSETGAQIESSVFPPVGCETTLIRGPLSVWGHVTWRTERRCGLHFSSQISVGKWMASPVNREQQQRIDQLIAVVKAGADPRAIPALGGAAAEVGIADDLTRVSRLLESLGNALATDPAIAIRHGAALRNLDIAVQKLAALAEATRVDVPNSADKLNRLAELRASCAAALQAT